MVRLANDAFVAQLGALFGACTTAGSVFINTKRVLGMGADAAAQPPAVLFRAATSKRKFSTVVAAQDYARFHTAYVATLKAHTPGLRKKVPSKKKKGAKKSAKQ